jgi:DNA gyrase subunit A
VYWLKVYLIPQASRGAKGRPLVNMLPLESAERITAVLPIPDFAEDRFVFMATANGTVKKTPLEQFSRQRSTGLIALELEAGNTLIGAAITDGYSDVLLISSSGKAARFKESDVRAMGRTARGVRGIRLIGRHRVISLIIPAENGYLLTASENGFGKRTNVTEFPVKGRGAQGVIAMMASHRNGELVGGVQVFAGDELMLISNMGTLVRTTADEVSLVGRNTQGVRLINLRGDEKLVGVARIVEKDVAGEDAGREAGEDAGREAGEDAGGAAGEPVKDPGEEPAEAPPRPGEEAGGESAADTDPDADT